MVETVVIIGGGFSGTLAAATILENTRARINVIMIDTDLRRIGGGVAYSGTTADPHHETNIAARRMGIENAPSPDKVAKRHLVAQWYQGKLEKAIAHAAKRNSTYRTIESEAVDISTDGNKAEVTLAGGIRIDADKVIVATGNNEIRELPCVTETLKQDPRFDRHYIANQWSQDAKQKIGALPRDARVLVVGTALSGYDAARTLLRQKHRGDIVLTSRHGLEPFQYPAKHVWKDLNLPTPRFMYHIAEPKIMMAEMVAEFHELTGLQVDPEKGTIKSDSFLQRAFSGRKNYLPEQVLKAWERYLPRLVRAYGAEAVGDILKKHSSLIGVLRVGAGKAICEEIGSAKKSGRLRVTTGNIDRIDVAPEGGLNVSFSKDGASRTEHFHTVISSLGANHDYTKTNSPLWRALLTRGYTTPHPLGVGVNIYDELQGHSLPRAGNIFAVGPCVAGHIMQSNGVIGPPAFSIPGTREHTTAVARRVAHDLTYPQTDHAAIVSLPDVAGTGTAFPGSAAPT